MSFQMALDEVLFRNMEENPGEPVLRFYYADGPSVTVGYSHKGTDKGTIPRMTGGGRVIHGDDLIFSLIARKEHDESFRSVRVSYWKIHEALKEEGTLDG